jgi:hypothetical protein
LTEIYKFRRASYFNKAGGVKGIYNIIKEGGIKPEKVCKTAPLPGDFRA